MNTKIAASVLALALTVIACRAPSPPSDQTPTVPAPTETATAVPTLPASETPEGPTEPRVDSTLWEVSNSPDLDKLFGKFPHTHLPTHAKALVVSFYLDVPEGWPEHKTEYCIVWFRNGSQLEGWEGSVVCSLEGDCYQIVSRHFEEDGYEAGRYEVRLYRCKDHQLLEGMQAEVQLIEEEWVGDLHVMQCDDGSVETCNNAAGQAAKFPAQVTLPAGRSTVFVANGYANLPRGAEWQVQLYDGDQLIDSRSHVITKEGTWSGRQESRLSDPNGAPLEPGLYTVKLIWRGSVIDTVSFEVKQSNGPTSNRLSAAQQN